ncbi:(4Fe-4S)-binding protein [Algivirga pacifica]|uniref:Iron-binding zinc finger CDGSH type domain-containing protein n=1 Tax=Algivirga pacifica TaxID=1162670 RepID=A0ABP9D0S3_9BACT
MSNKTKEYKKDGLVIVWKPEKCIHSGVCVKMLPKVYNPKGRPWITPEHASISELKNQIDQCPSGALSYYMSNQSSSENTMEQLEKEKKVEIMKNGPIIVHGPCSIIKNGEEIKSASKTTALCRCGASGNKPYCDGSHARVNFQG